jgi:hypothetical protein
MDTQPEALRLADRLESDFIRSQTMLDAATELRRLHAENERLASAADKIRRFWRNEVHRLLAQRDALLEALKLARSIIGHPDDAHSQMIDAVIKAVEETK